MADTLQSLGLRKPDFTTLPPDFQGDPGTLVDPQAYVDVLRRQGLVAGAAGPVVLSPDLPRALKAYGAGIPMPPLVDQNDPDRSGLRPERVGGQGGTPPDGREQVPLQRAVPDAGAVRGAQLTPVIPFVAGGAGFTNEDIGGQTTGGGRPTATPAATAPGQSWGDLFKDSFKTSLSATKAALGALSSNADMILNGRSPEQHYWDQGTGLLSGLAQIPASLAHIDGYVSGWLGDKESEESRHRWGDKIGGYFDQFADPSSSTFQVSKLAGEAAPALIAPEITPFTYGAEAFNAGRIASEAARYADMAAQGAGVGTLASGGKDMGHAALTGALLGPAFSVAGDALMPVGRGVGAAGDRLKALVKGLRGKAGADGTIAGEETGLAPDLGPAASPPPSPPPAEDVAYAKFLAGLQSRFDNNASLEDLYQYANDHGVKPEGIPDLPVAVRNRDDHHIPVRFVPMRQLDLPVADFASGEITPASYADAIIAGRGEGDGPEALALRQYGATNGPAIEAEFSRRADEATRAGPGNMTPIVPRRSAATIEEARAAASEFVGQPIMHPETGVTATMTKNSLKKVTHEKAISASDTVANHSLAIANADDLYRSSRHLFDHADPRGEPTLRIGRGSSYVKTQDGVRGVKITTKETAHAGNPNTLYTVQTMPLDPVVEVPRWTGEVEPGLLPTDRSVSVLGKPARTRFFLGRSSESPLTPADTSDNDIARLAGVMRNAAATASGTQDGSRNGGRSAAGTALNPGGDQDRSPPDPGAAGAAERARAQRVAEGLRRDAARRGTPALAAAWQRQQLKQKRLQQHRRSN